MLTGVFHVFVEFFYILKSSISSIKFYRDLYKNWSGYGIKFVTILMMISSLIYMTSFILQINSIESYLYKDVNGQGQIEYILSNFPEVHYNGKSISVDEDLLIYLVDGSKNELCVIDVQNILKYDEIKNIPIILKKDYMIINAKKHLFTKSRSEQIKLDYTTIFGKQIFSVNRDNLLFGITKIFANLGIVLYLILFMLLVILKFAIYLINNIFPTLLLFFILRYFKVIASVDQVIRITLISSSFFGILIALILCIFPPALTFISFFEFFPLLFAIYSIVTMSRPQRFKSFF